MKTILTGVKYNIDNDGATQSIDVSFNGYDDGESTTTTARITDGDLDSLSRKDIENAGRKKAATFFDTTDAASTTTTTTTEQPTVGTTTDSQPNVANPSATAE